MTRRDLLACALILAFLGSGCGSDAAPPAPPTKRAMFIQDQQETVTPAGPIDLSSVQETPEGVRYQTADGRWWEVQMTPRPGGGYAYGVLRSAEPESSR